MFSACQHGAADCDLVGNTIELDEGGCGSASGFVQSGELCLRKCMKE